MNKDELTREQKLALISNEVAKTKTMEGGKDYLASILMFGIKGYSDYSDEELNTILEGVVLHEYRNPAMLDAVYEKLKTEYANQ